VVVIHGTRLEVHQVASPDGRTAAARCAHLVDRLDIRHHVEMARAMIVPHIVAIVLQVLATARVDAVTLVEKVERPQASRLLWLFCQEQSTLISHAACLVLTC
jgi:hypothetical protein